MEESVNEIAQETRAAVKELLEAAMLQPGKILVVGCSTSEIRGSRIGSNGSPQIAAAVLKMIRTECAQRGVYMAAQCCEHLNRALVVERGVAREYGLEEVCVVPVPTAGGSFAAQAMQDYADPVVVEKIQAHAGLDIGSTLIGMHLRPVAVPVRLKNCRIGNATVTAAKTRPKLIGGARAIYVRDSK